jgi:beta-lactamase class A
MAALAGFATLLQFQRDQIYLMNEDGASVGMPVAHEELDRQVRAAIASFQCTVSLYAKNLDTGAAYGLREGERVRTASTIKLPVMAAVFAAVDRGEAKWTDEMVLRDAAKVPGAGILQDLSDGTRLTRAGFWLPV